MYDFNNMYFDDNTSENKDLQKNTCIILDTLMI